MKRTTRRNWFILLAVMVSLAGWIGYFIGAGINASSPSTSPTATEETGQVSVEPTASEAPGDVRSPTVVSSATRQAIHDVLTVFFASPGERKLQPKDVVASTTPYANSELAATWAGTDPGIKVSIVSATVSASGVITNNSVLTATAKVVTSTDVYGDKQIDKWQATVTMVLSGSNWVVDSIEELPDEG